MSPTHAFPPRKILVPIDMGEVSESTLKYARYFLERFGSGLIVLHAHHFELPPYFSSGQLEDFKRELRKMGRGAKEYIRKYSESILGSRPDIKTAESAPAEAIIEASRSSGVEMILMGTLGRRGVERFWMGSVAEQVIRRSAVPVLAIRNAPPEKSIQNILCPMNPSETGKQALEYAAEISKALSAHLTVLHVVEQGDEPLTCPLVGEQIKNTCSVEEIQSHGNAAKTIAEASNNLKPDLIVMGAERKSAVLGDFFSSTTSSVMQLAIEPLLVVPRKEVKDSTHD
jgi:nucleotide-binding universal stress UspA family protein